MTQNSQRPCLVRGIAPQSRGVQRLLPIRQAGRVIALEVRRSSKTTERLNLGPLMTKVASDPQTLLENRVCSHIVTLILDNHAKCAENPTFERPIPDRLGKL
jgi:hypothetical protein